MSPDTRALTSRNGVASNTPFEMIRIFPPFSTTNRRVTSLGGAVRYSGKLNPLATGCRPSAEGVPGPAGLLLLFLSHDRRRHTPPSTTSCAQRRLQNQRTGCTSGLRYDRFEKCAAGPMLLDLSA